VGFGVLAAVVALLIFIAVGLISGTITKPTQDEIILLGSSLVLLIFSYLKSRDKLEEKDSVEKKEG
jgi:hypothetical protein